MSEIRPIPSYGGKYLVSDDGRVYSAWNTRNNPLPAPKELAQRIRKDRYVDVQVRIDGKNKHPLVHVLVAQAFIGPKNGLDCNHKDGNKQNNSVSNLEYLSRSENVFHAIRTGLKIPANGRSIAKTRLHEKDIQDIREAVAAARLNGRAPNGAMLEIANRYGVSRSAIDHVARGDCWRHV